MYSVEPRAPSFIGLKRMFVAIDPCTKTLFSDPATGTRRSKFSHRLLAIGIGFALAASMQSNASAKIVFTSDQTSANIKNGEADWNGFNIWMMNDDGSDQSLLTSADKDRDGFFDKQFSYPQFSPDGRHIAYVEVPGGEDSRHAIHVMNEDGSGDRMVSSKDDLDVTPPRWSADSRRISYSSFRDSSDRSVRVISVDTGENKVVFTDELFSVIGSAMVFPWLNGRQMFLTGVCYFGNADCDKFGKLVDADTGQFSDIASGQQLEAELPPLNDQPGDTRASCARLTSISSNGYVLGANEAGITRTKIVGGFGPMEVFGLSALGAHVQAYGVADAGEGEVVASVERERGSHCESLSDIYRFSFAARTFKRLTFSGDAAKGNLNSATNFSPSYAPGVLAAVPAPRLGKLHLRKLKGDYRRFLDPNVITKRSTRTLIYVRKRRLDGDFVTANLVTRITVFARMRVDLFRGSRKLRSKTSDVLAPGTRVFDPTPLMRNSLRPGKYALRVTLIGQDGAKSRSKRKSFRLRLVG